MRELVLTCALAMLGSGCVEVVSHRDEFDAGPDVAPSDGRAEVEVSSGLCQSGVRWSGGMASALHFPGRPCMGGGCHTTMSKTPMTMGGTVYPLKGEHDEADCNGVNGSGAAIVVMDDSGNELPGVGRIQLNNAGNFYTARTLPPSYKVKLLYLGSEAPMIAPVTNGDCNYCHTSEDYMMAKGRIVPKAP